SSSLKLLLSSVDGKVLSGASRSVGGSGGKSGAVLMAQVQGIAQGGGGAEVLPDRKRVTTRSFLPVLPVDTDTGRNFTCIASNPAIPTGKRTTVSLNVHRGVLLEGARESVFVTTADHSFFTEPVSCQVFNAVGSTNVSILVDVHFGPVLVVEPRPLTVDIDSDVTLNCKWAGNPPLTLTWTKKGSNMVLSNNNQLYLKSVSQSDAGQYVCKAIVPRIGVGETEVTLTVNGPPIISSDPVQYAVRGERGEVKCYIASTPPPDKIVWAWKENVWEKEKGTLLERYTVEQSKPHAQGGAVLSTLTINNVMESDFHSPYNCTAWNAFGPGTMIITLEETEIMPVGVIAGSTVGSSILLLLSTRMVKAMYSPFKDDMELKQDLRSDTLDTREEYELKDPTNGYYNVRATTHEDARPSSRSMLYPEYRPANPAGAGGAGGGAGVGGSATASGGGAAGARGGCYDPRPPSRLSHSSYAQFNTFTRGGQPQPAPPNPTPQTGEFPADCSLLDSSAQLAYDSYGPTHYPYRLGFAPPMEGGPAYEMYGAGPGAGSETAFSPIAVKSSMETSPKPTKPHSPAIRRNLTQTHQATFSSHQEKPHPNPPSHILQPSAETSPKPTKPHSPAISRNLTQTHQATFSTHQEKPHPNPPSHILQPSAETSPKPTKPHSPPISRNLTQTHQATFSSHQEKPHPNPPSHILQPSAETSPKPTKPHSPPISRNLAQTHQATFSSHQQKPRPNPPSHILQPSGETSPKPTKPHSPPISRNLTQTHQATFSSHQEKPHPNPPSHILQPSGETSPKPTKPHSPAIRRNLTQTHQATFSSHQEKPHPNPPSHILQPSGETNWKILYVIVPQELRVKSGSLFSTRCIT
ncbi:hypothetical protein JZ751_027462, partial [Albula glossodonta]